MTRNEANCDRCLPKVFSEAMGYIPLPEMTNIGDTRVDERRILLCRYHYFEAKKNCFYVVPFNRDEDPVDSFLSRVKQKHKLIRGNNRLNFKASSNFQEDDLPPPILDIEPRLVRNGKKTNKQELTRV